MRLPEFTPAAMTRLINKRNQKFRRAVTLFLETCTEQVLFHDRVTKFCEKLDPWLYLNEISSKYFPRDNVPSHEPVSSSQFAFPTTCDLTMSDLVQCLKTTDDYRDQIVPGGHRTFSEKPARFGKHSYLLSFIPGKLSQDLSPELLRVLHENRQIPHLYSHQATAINRLSEGKHVIVSTSTASGKSLIYQIPVLDALQDDKSIKALYIFPTKALAQDQKKSLQNIISAISSLSHIVVDTFDGDTPHSDRSRIRETASGITNRIDHIPGN